jgi:hypothetical protein
MKKNCSLFKKTDKKAALTTQQIVILIILITSFLVIMYFLFRLSFQEEADKEVCHQSVILRGNAIIAKESIPLNCKTNYVCITADGSCEDLPYYTYKRTVDDKKETNLVLAEEMADCWWMFGEGKINYVSDTFFKNLYCSICSQIEFDDSMKEIFTNGIIDKDLLYKTLQEEKMPGQDISYSEYLFRTKDVSKLLLPPAQSFGEIDIDKGYAVIMGVYSERSSLGWALAGAGALALGAVVVSVAVTPIGWVSGAIIVGVATAGGGVGGYYAASEIQGTSGLTYLSPTIVEFPSAEYDALKCEGVETLG